MSHTENNEDPSWSASFKDENIEMSGFICPACPNFVSFDSEELLLQHWKACHDFESSNIIDTSSEGQMWQSHLFTETCRAGKICRFCGQRIWRDGLQCSACHYPCHIKCSTKARYTSNCPGFYQSANRIVKSIRKVVTGHKVRYVTDYVDLDLTYITPRIIDVAAMLRSRHRDAYLVFNVSDKEYDISKLNNQVLDFGWPDHMAPPLERLCSIINSMGSWLDSDPNHVAVVHCKGGKGRTGVVIAAYFSYMRLFPRPEDAMMHFALKRFSNAEEAGDVGITNPSQRRYVNYFQDIVSGKLQVWPRPLRLMRIMMQTVPHFDKQKGCRPILAIYEEMNRELYKTSECLQYFSKTDHFMSLNINDDDGVIVRGDVMIKIWHRSRHGNDHLILRLQFHTASVDGDVLTFEKSDLDEAYRDKRIDDAATLALIFEPIHEEPSLDDIKNSASATLYKHAREKFPDSITIATELSLDMPSTRDETHASCKYSQDPHAEPRCLSPPPESDSEFSQTGHVCELGTISTEEQPSNFLMENDFRPMIKDTIKPSLIETDLFPQHVNTIGRDISQTLEAKLSTNASDAEQLCSVQRPARKFTINDSYDMENYFAVSTESKTGDRDEYIDIVGSENGNDSSVVDLIEYKHVACYSNKTGTDDCFKQGSDDTQLGSQVDVKIMRRQQSRTSHASDSASEHAETNILQTDSTISPAQRDGFVSNPYFAGSSDTVPIIIKLREENHESCDEYKRFRCLKNVPSSIAHSQMNELSQLEGSRGNDSMANQTDCKTGCNGNSTYGDYNSCIDSIQSVSLVQDTKESRPTTKPSKSEISILTPEPSFSRLKVKQQQPNHDDLKLFEDNSNPRTNTSRCHEKCQTSMTSCIHMQQIESASTTVDGGARTIFADCYSSPSISSSHGTPSFATHPCVSNSSRQPCHFENRINMHDSCQVFASYAPLIESWMPREHETRSWYFGRMSQGATERLLLEKARDSAFVVRRSWNHVFQFYFSLRFKNQVFHVSIRWEPIKEKFIVGHSFMFCSIVDAVHFFQKNGLPREDGTLIPVGDGFGVHGLEDSVGLADATAFGTYRPRLVTKIKRNHNSCDDSTHLTRAKPAMS